MHEAGPGGTEAVVTRNTTTKKTTYEIKLPAAFPRADGARRSERSSDSAWRSMTAIRLTPGQKGWGGLGAHAIVFGKTPQQTAHVTLGIGSGSAACFISAISPPRIAALDKFTFRGNDFEKLRRQSRDHDTS